MTYIISSRTDPINGIKHIEQSIDPGWERDDEKETDLHARKECDGCENDSADRPGCANRSVLLMISVNQHAEKISTNKTGKINDQKRNHTDIGFQSGTEKKQGKHIEQQVLPVHMQKTGTYQPDIFFIDYNFIKIEGIPVVKSMVLKSLIRKEQICDNYNQGNCSHGTELIF
jgi:hypothetical protein